MRTVARFLLAALAFFAIPGAALAQESSPNAEEHSGGEPYLPTLSVSPARPDRVEIWVAEQLIGKSNFEQELPGLVSTVQLRAHGYEPLTVALEADTAPDFVVEDVRLEPLPASLTVIANVDGAEVIIDRTEEGTIELPRPLEIEVDSDSRLIRVRADDYRTFIAPLILEPGKEALITAVLIPDDDDDDEDEDNGESEDKIDMQLSLPGPGGMGGLGANAAGGSLAGTGAPGSAIAAGSATAAEGAAADEPPVAAENAGGEDEEPIVADNGAADEPPEDEPEERESDDSNETESDEEEASAPAPGVQQDFAREGSAGLRTAGISTVSAGALSLGLGVVFWNSASNARDDRDAASTDAEFQNAQDRARSRATLSNVFYGIGFTSAAAGTYMWIRGRGNVPGERAGAATRFDVSPRSVRMTVEF